jgi:L-rhamnose mutarotase
MSLRQLAVDSLIAEVTVEHSRNNCMKRVGFQFKVRQDLLEEYREHHKHVWPEMLAALRETGWHNYTLFMRSDGLIFGYFETDTDLPKM